MLNQVTQAIIPSSVLAWMPGRWELSPGHAEPDRLR